MASGLYAKGRNAHSRGGIHPPRELVLAHSLAEFGQGYNLPTRTPRREAPYASQPQASCSGFLLGLQHLPALVHAGLEVEMVRTAQLAGVLVLDISGLLERVGRAAHATARRRGFSAGNGHFGIL